MVTKAGDPAMSDHGEAVDSQHYGPLSGSCIGPFQQNSREMVTTVKMTKLDEP